MTRDEFLNAAAYVGSLARFAVNPATEPPAPLAPWDITLRESEACEVARWALAFEGTRTLIKEYARYLLAAERHAEPEDLAELASAIDWMLGALMRSLQ